MKIFRLTTTMLLLTMLLSGCAIKKLWSGNDGPALSGRVTGSVAYRERIALPPNARVIVTLEDVSRKDASGAFIAQQTLQPKTQVPIAFDLRYIPSAIDRKHKYAVRAAIIDTHDETLWTSTESTPVLFNESDKAIAIMVERVVNPATQPAPAINTVTGFKCDDFAFIVKFSNAKVDIALAGRNVILPQVISASGARYSDGSTTFWNKGDGAIFELNGVSYKNCKADPVAPAK
jgi:putative lipoprotein